MLIILPPPIEFHGIVLPPKKSVTYNLILVFLSIIRNSDRGEITVEVTDGLN